MPKTLVNMGPRTFRLKPAVKIVGKDKEGKDIIESVPRVLYPHGMPGSSVEAMDDAEAASMLAYRDIKEASNVVPGVTDKIEKLEREKQELEESNARLKSQLKESPAKAESEANKEAAQDEPKAPVKDHQPAGKKAKRKK